MPQVTLADFWDSEDFYRLKHPAPVKSLLLALQSDASASYDLLFYSAFAHRIFAVMQREGKDTPGFVRMQQSFSEAVDKVRKSLGVAEQKGFLEVRRYTELSQSGMQSLLALASDLASVKKWQVENGMMKERDASENA